ncbi:MAG: ferritin-like domain-containing protein [Myxococcota bacterium]
MNAVVDWMPWVAHFERNRHRPLPPITDGLDQLPAPLAAALAVSLAKFQQGETGEGRIANEVGHIGWASIDPAYVAALRAFVAEEGRHAKILGLAVRALGARSQRSEWSARLFAAGRRLVDPRFELVALLGAEVAAIAAYQAIVDALPEGGLRVALRELVADEEEHLRFHASLFAAEARTGARRVALVASLSSVLAAAAAVLVADHAALWRALGVSPVALTAAVAQLGRRALVATASPPALPSRGEMAA